MNAMELIIRPKNKWWKIDWKELWYFRDLFYVLAWRDLKVKYKQTTIGAFWAIFQPLITMVVFTVFFGQLAQIPSNGVPYPIFVYSGLLFWTLFNTGLTNASASFVMNEKIVTKVYFPKIILPVASIVTCLVDFAIAAVILVGMMAYYRFIPAPSSIIALPLLVILTVLTTFGIGLICASINVKYRDVRYILPFFLQLLMFVTPVIYPAHLIPASYRWLLGLNPMSGVISSARSVLFNSPEDWTLLVISIIAALVYCMFGIFYFKKVERYFADII